MHGLPDAEIGAIVERMAPMLDILINGSTDVNIGRAEQCGSVATPASTRHPRSSHSSRTRRTAREAHTATSRVVPEMRLLTPAEVVDLAERVSRRFPAAIREARAAARRKAPSEPADRAAVALQERNVPAAFVPPLAVLISLHPMEGTRSR